jgi:hypothetical protein
MFGFGCQVANSYETAVHNVHTKSVTVSLLLLMGKAGLDTTPVRGKSVNGSR